MLQQITLKNVGVGLVLFFASLLTLFVGTVGAQLETKKSLCGGANLTFSKGVAVDEKGNQVKDANGDPIHYQSCNQEGDPEKTLNELIAQIVNIFSVIVGIVAVIMIIIGGFKYITSGGDSGSVTSAKNTILYAIVGLVIVALAQVIVRFVINKVAPT